MRLRSNTTDRDELSSGVGTVAAVSALSTTLFSPIIKIHNPGPFKVFS